MINFANCSSNFRFGSRVSTAIVAGAVTAVVFAATVFDPDSQPIWTAPSFALKSTDLESGDTRAYRGWFENGAWQGDIIEYVIKKDGERITDASVGTNPPVAGVTNWTARATFDAQEVAIADYWKNGRKIISHNGTRQTALLWSNLSVSERGLIDPDTAAEPSKTAAYDSPVLNFMRGERSNEQPAGLRATRRTDAKTLQPVGRYRRIEPCLRGRANRPVL